MDRGSLRAQVQGRCPVGRGLLRGQGRLLVDRGSTRIQDSPLDQVRGLPRTQGLVQVRGRCPVRDSLRARVRGLAHNRGRGLAPAQDLLHVRVRGIAQVRGRCPVRDSPHGQVRGLARGQDLARAQGFLRGQAQGIAQVRARCRGQGQDSADPAVAVVHGRDPDSVGRAAVVARGQEGRAVADNTGCAVGNRVHVPSCAP